MLWWGRLARVELTSMWYLAALWLPVGEMATYGLLAAVIYLPLVDISMARAFFAVGVLTVLSLALNLMAPVVLE